MLRTFSKHIIRWLYIVGLLLGNQSLSDRGVYKGCFKDSGERTMSNMYKSNDMTVSLCIYRCYDLHYPYAGLQNTKECFCGDETYSRLGQQPEAECDMICAGNQQEICGGPWRNSVYTARLSDTHTAIYKSSEKSDGLCQTLKGSCTRCAIACLRVLQCKSFRYYDGGCYLMSDSNDETRMKYMYSRT